MQATDRGHVPPVARVDLTEPGPDGGLRSPVPHADSRDHE
jgi:hypothetical protein